MNETMRQGAGPLRSGDGAADGAGGTASLSLSFMRDHADPILVLNGEGRVSFMNRAGRTRLMSPGGGLPGSAWWDYWPPGAASLLVRAVERGMSGNGARFLSRTRGPAGGEDWWDISLSPIASGEGPVESLLVICRETAPLGP